MNLSALRAIGTRGLGRGLLAGKKFAPEILTGVGVVGVVVAGILAAKATLKLEQTQTEIEENLATIKELQQSPGTAVDLPEYNREIAKAYFKAAVKYGKLYGPSILLGAASIACLIGSNQILRKRNVALVAAYKTLESGFNEYRKAVIAAIGEDEERKISLRAVEQIEHDEEGKEVTKTKHESILPYVRMFDRYNDNWKTNPDSNIFFLKSHQNFFNKKLITSGHVFLNDVLEVLGYEHTAAGAVTGWMYEGDGDNVIDFGVFDDYNSDPFFYDDDNNRAEPVIRLEFNVDGNIIDKI